VSGSTIPSNTAIITANEYAERMGFRIGTKFSSLGHAQRRSIAARAQLILAAFAMVVNGFRG
jgi:hypothetical protein